MRSLKRLALFLIIPMWVAAQSGSITWQKHVIADTLPGIKKVAIGNIDKDSNRARDIAVTMNPESDRAEDSTKANVIWFANDGAQNFTEFVIDFKLTGARGIALGDLTGDGYPDLAVGSRADSIPLVIYKNSGAPETLGWTRQEIGGPAPDNYEVKIVDLDRDGWLDVVDGFGDDAEYGAANSGTVQDSIRFLKNTGRSDTLILRNKLVAQVPSPAAFDVGWLDSDTLYDVAMVDWLDYFSSTAQTGEDLTWWAQQTDTSFVQQQQIIDYYGGNDVQIVDMNGDKAPDIVAVGYKSQTLDWWRNDGSGNFTDRVIIDQNLIRPRHVQVSDLDGDGDMDIALTVDNANTVYWYENDGQQNFTRYTIDDAFTYAYFICANDLDGDGDLDLVGTAQDAGELAWWENNSAQTQDVAAGSPDTLDFYGTKLRIKYASPYPGGLTSVFLNYGPTPDSTAFEAGLQKVTSSAFYTIVSHAATYEASLIVRYDSIPAWQNLSAKESDLRFCFWNDTAGNGGEWQILQPGSQVIDTAKNVITISQVTQALHKYSLFTLGVSSGPSAIERSAPAVASVNDFKLFSFPNPFNGQANIEFMLPGGSHPVRLEIFNARGQKVRTLFSGNLFGGRHRFNWKGQNERGVNVSSGWYFYRLFVAGKRQSGKMLLVR